ncbi:MAG: tRNA (N(6)-L-threonylcarbamoyladenosine(37)-C(2))-methylthiotransferase MtaB [Oscillospiraceae bacterium]|nr:tRNA (N(6)-L-threonylcarbamoyladenosine(37)-C(2))-methylthiotransferase MtaB [Oscillospiraceae bacterium]
MTVAYYTFGCKVNQYETDCIAELMERNGFVTIDDPMTADVVVINSCTVTQAADVKLGQLLRRVRRQNPDAITVVAGCYPQAHGVTELINKADIIVGEANKTKIPELISDFLANKEHVCEIPSHQKGEKLEEMSLSKRAEKTRAIIKIQDGCDRFCSYCIIPYARGRSRSKPIEEIEAEARELALQGHRELILVGINLSCYGEDLGEIDLADAVHAACLSTADRIRLGSIEPEMLMEVIIRRLSQEEKLCPHFHLSLQSGCDRTLERMRRRYNTEKYRKLIRLLREYFPDCAVTTDVMVGFPDETEDDFLKSVEFVKEISFAGVHVFSYSEREGTVAARMPGSIPKAERYRRAEIMSEAAKIGEEAFQEAHIGKTVSVLFEHEKDGDFHQGHTKDYLMVKVPKIQDTLWKEIRDVRVTVCKDNCLYGEIINPTAD